MSDRVVEQGLIAETRYVAPNVTIDSSASNFLARTYGCVPNK